MNKLQDDVDIEIVGKIVEIRFVAFSANRKTVWTTPIRLSVASARKLARDISAELRRDYESS